MLAWERLARSEQSGAAVGAEVRGDLLAGISRLGDRLGLAYTAREPRLLKC